MGNVGLASVIFYENSDRPKFSLFLKYSTPCSMKEQVAKLLRFHLYKCSLYISNIIVNLCCHDFKLWISFE